MAKNRKSQSKTKKMKLVINEQIIVTANDFLTRGLMTTLINAINEELEPPTNEFIVDLCEELNLPYEVFDEVEVVGHRPRTIRH